MNTILLISSHKLLFTHVANGISPSGRKIRQLKGLERENRNMERAPVIASDIAPIHTLEIY
jgi:hypothetical protein